jgi:hypothetical protein
MGVRSTCLLICKLLQVCMSCQTAQNDWCDAGSHARWQTGTQSLPSSPAGCARYLPYETKVGRSTHWRSVSSKGIDEAG